MIPLFGLAMRMRKIVYPSSWDAQQRAAEMTTVVEEATSGVRVVKGFGQEARELDRLTERAVALFGARMRNTRLSATRQATMQVIPSLGQAAMLALGGWLVLTEGLTLGTFLAFQQYLVQLVLGRCRACSSWPRTRAGAERIFELLDSTPTSRAPGASRLAPFAGVEFTTSRSATLRAGDHDRFDLEVAPGETVALVSVGLRQIHRVAAPPLLRRPERAILSTATTSATTWSLRRQSGSCSRTRS